MKESFIFATFESTLRRQKSTVFAAAKFSAEKREPKISLEILRFGTFKSCKNPSMNVNPFCSPRFRPSVSGSPQQIAFAFGVPDEINGFHPYSIGSICL